MMGSRGGLTQLQQSRLQLRGKFLMNSCHSAKSLQENDTGCLILAKNYIIMAGEALKIEKKMFEVGL